MDRSSPISFFDRGPIARYKGSTFSLVSEEAATTQETSHSGYFKLVRRRSSDPGDASWWGYPIPSTSFELPDDAKPLSGENTTSITLSSQDQPLTASPTVLSATSGSISPTVPSPPVPGQHAPHGYTFGCDICFKTFDRASRLEACRNRHASVKPHACMGHCGSAEW